MKTLGEQAKWIWSAHWRAEDKDAPGLMLFRKILHIEKDVKECIIRISADTRYKLYINGEFVDFGPAKGDRQVWYYDTLSVGSFFQNGDNCIGVVVLRYPEDREKGNHSMFRTSIPGLILDGKILYEDDSAETFCSDESWRCKKDIRVSFAREEERFAPLIVHESVYGDPSFRAWKLAGYEDHYWENVLAYPDSQINQAISPGNLLPRPIPALYRKPRKFLSAYNIRMSRFNQSQWGAFLQGKEPLVIPPYSRELVELDAGEEMTGFICAAFEKGMGSKIRILYSECYVQNEQVGPEHLPVKTDRTDKRGGHLEGYWDSYRLYGQGNEIRAERYMPFWFRTFRYVQLTIETGSEPMIFKSFDYEETGYPLQVKTSVRTSDPSMDRIWEISERTLRRCMHETYEDCPYYEQLQYIMDTRTQILYTYAISGDDRLARSCIEAMYRGQRYDGLMNCSYPNYNTNVIPGFSIFYILMLYDHMMYFDDKNLLVENMPAVEKILNYYHGNLTADGYVGRLGGMIGSRFWSFIDWAKEWNDTNGVPTAILQGPLTMESLLYIYGLQTAAKILTHIKRPEEAAFYEEEAVRVQKALLTYCMGEKGMLTDGPHVEEYSQHVQVFAALTDTVAEKEQRENLLCSILEPGFAQCTVAMCFYLFRAMEKTGLYEYANRYWDIWRSMIDNNCTTCVESEAYARSECHGWGALALYELPAAVLGVRPGAPGFSKVRISPQQGHVTSAQGSVHTPKGEILVSWKLEGEKMKLSYTLPEGMEIEKEESIE